MSRNKNGQHKKRTTVRNPVAAASRRVNRPKVERDRTKYRRKEKHHANMDHQ